MNEEEFRTRLKEDMVFRNKYRKTTPCNKSLLDLCQPERLNPEDAKSSVCDSLNSMET